MEILYHMCDFILDMIQNMNGTWFSFLTFLLIMYLQMIHSFAEPGKANSNYSKTCLECVKIHMNHS